jgi:hypothetical protein
MSSFREQAKMIDPRTGESEFRWYVWGYGPKDKTRRRQIIWGASAASVQQACWRQGFRVIRIDPAPPMDYWSLTKDLPEDHDA